MLDIPCGENLIRELTGLVPVFIAKEALLQDGLKLVAERGPDMPALEATGRANDRDGEGVDAPPQVGESVLAKAVFHLAAFGFLASLFPLKSCSLDHAVDERCHVTRRRRRAEAAKRAFQIGGQAESDVRWRVCVKLPLCSGNYLSESGSARLSIVVAGFGISR